MTLYSKILVLERVSDPKSYFYTLLYNICEIHVSFRKLIIRPKFVVYVPYYVPDPSVGRESDVSVWPPELAQLLRGQVDAALLATENLPIA